MNGSQLVAVYAAVFGALLAIHGFMATGKTRYYLAGVFLLLCIMGLIGAFEHFGARKTKEGMALVQQVTAATAGRYSASGGSWFARFTSPPIMAPLSLSALSFLGMCTLFVRSEPNDVSNEPDNNGRKANV